MGVIMEIITYESLYEILRREKYEKELQKIDENFFKSIINYMKEKEELIKKTTLFTLEIDKTRKQIENIKKIIKEIYEKRENKIIQLALFSSRFNQKQSAALLEEEKPFYESLLNIFNNSRKNILFNVLSSNLPVIETLEEKPKELKTVQETTKLIRFLHAVPKFVGTDLNIYGPFEAEDIASLSNEIANLLIEKNRAEQIKNDNSKNSE